MAEPTSTHTYAARQAAARTMLSEYGARLAARFGLDPAPLQDLADGSLDDVLEPLAKFLFTLDCLTAPATPPPPDGRLEVARVLTQGALATLVPRLGCETHSWWQDRRTSPAVVDALEAAAIVLTSLSHRLATLDALGRPRPEEVPRG